MTKRKTPTPKKPSGGQPKNKNAEKFGAAAERIEAFRLYCLHLAAGYSGSSFYEPCVEETIDNLKKKYPQDFDADLERRARAKGRMFWEDVGNKGTTGRIKGFNAHSWKFNMQNRLGWKDRSEHGLDAPTRAVFKLKMGKPLDTDK